jgi:Fic family protein
MRMIMPTKKYNIDLTVNEIERLDNILKANFSKRIKMRAEILLRINISKMLGASQNTITNTLNRYLDGGIDYVIIARNRPI